jgi:hypothetical protein
MGISIDVYVCDAFVEKRNSKTNPRSFFQTLGGVGSVGTRGILPKSDWAGFEIFFIKRNEQYLAIPIV